MKESLLHFIWGSLNFNFTNLQTENGLPILILFPGTLNENQGPDFLNAKLKINGINWTGHVEIHINSSEWYKHKHQHDVKYNAVILHVVFSLDEFEILRQDGSQIPQLSLGNRISPELIHTWEQMNLSLEKIPCDQMFSSVKDEIIQRQIENCGINRIKNKANQLRKGMQKSTDDWEQVIWRELAGSLGGKVNRQAFLTLCDHIPYHLIRQYRLDPIAIEAILFGASGMLQSRKNREPYYQALRNEWYFLKKKHRLSEKYIEFKFLRMRPSSFPTIRISQLGSILQQIPHLVNFLLADQSGLIEKMKIECSAYWKSHVRFGEESTNRLKNVGTQMKQNLIINTLIPLTLNYFKAHGRGNLDEIILDRLKKIPAEDNRITRLYEKLGIQAKNALESQGMIELYKAYCTQKKCLTCAVGKSILQEEAEKWQIIPSLSLALAQKPGSS